MRLSKSLVLAVTAVAALSRTPLLAQQADPPLTFPDLEFAGAEGGAVRLSQLKAPEDAGQMTAMGIPSTFVLAADRKVLDQQVGFSPEVEEHWKQLIEKNSRARKGSR